MIQEEFKFYKPCNMGGKTKRAMLSERSEVGSRDVSVSYGAMS